MARLAGSLSEWHLPGSLPLATATCHTLLVHGFRYVVSQSYILSDSDSTSASASIAVVVVAFVFVIVWQSLIIKHNVLKTPCCTVGTDSNRSEVPQLQDIVNK